MEKPRVTEIQVRMDCNGCVQKIKKALHGINGIYDLYVDFPQQKITIIGLADPQKIAKAIKKTRKTAIICSHSETSDDQPSEPAPDGGAPESTNQPTAEAAPQAEAPKESPLPENPPSEAANGTPTNQPPLQPKVIEEIHVIHHHAPDGCGYGYGEQGNQHGRVEQSQAHSYNAYKPTPYVTDYAYINRLSPPAHSQYYNRPADQYTYTNEENRAGSNGNITSIFSDENPNACRIV
ncbi:heavy metal-associated isoprenylated plant 35-like [Olea europaea subsp. europaea]|uniref:Heavy metal-associated isoprenylated plant 35-like n=1 Tax=Olea europaea subsp. europaea TaxID=158383 RepID=A0A8S0V6I4_OLEEU|nr:heavy metal-associated isoprenylated plant 35-like [Olea europaea subsp. europaea]